MKTTDVKAYSNGKDTGIQVFVCKDYDALSAKAAAIVSGEINKKAHFILGLATGTSPIGLYTELANLNAEGKVDFSGVTTYNLDEYYPIAPEHDQSYRYFMNKYLFNKVNIDMAETHLLKINRQIIHQVVHLQAAMIPETVIPADRAIILPKRKNRRKRNHLHLSRNLHRNRKENMNLLRW